MSISALLPIFVRDPLYRQAVVTVYATCGVLSIGLVQYARIAKKLPSSKAIAFGLFGPLFFWFVLSIIGELIRENILH